MEFKLELIMTQGRLLRVGIDTGRYAGQMLGPIFDDNTYEYIPVKGDRYLPMNDPLYYRTYNMLQAQHDGTLIDYIVKNRKTEFNNLLAHLDPEFTTYTYGEPGIYNTKQISLRRLDPGDLLIFQIGLRDEMTRKNCIFGYFIIEEVVDLSKIKRGSTKFKDVEPLIENNAHYIESEGTQDSLIIVGDQDRSRMLEYAEPFTELMPDSIGRDTAKITKEYEEILGIGGFAQRNIRVLPPKRISSIISYLEELN